ncbi:uncharacterized protein BXZ73DRAFT_92977 [Epithele typhae]|uniref:uncharacterized protein n=1 Tax=Epithele typhae TaxID=378194 RepID=UPI0020082902|nr:uncharacterized protein BXZ73DRAFT_92977 [Epithele typhae]KAH9913331.1 hypothetical protein BXZ73DRAFT_92977 [Epithele typhae]
MSSPTELYLPSTLPYPLKLVSFAVAPDTPVQRGSRLLDYSFTHIPPDDPDRLELRFGTWDSSLEGTFSRWSFKLGEVITDRRARDTPAAYILEPCKHGVQIGGLCCLCGKDMTRSVSPAFLRASLPPAGSRRRRCQLRLHRLFRRVPCVDPDDPPRQRPTVSFEEAERIERETAEHLFRSRKLSLIVDLDQTIVHATVDPTVGEWITEGEAWEARQANKAADAENSDADKAEPGEQNGSPGADPAKAVAQDDDDVNPNWEALKDVKKFKLGPEALGQPHQRNKSKGKEKLIEQEGCMYYIKPRPGLPEFLKTMATKYEMHVYTMGTRAYAEEVCAAIDSDGKIFGNRILSRDESGSLTQKSLQRLFPCDQSMVVIIDDRADVWEWSPNLVKVIPYDFFVGIGDINSAFLPKLEPMAPPASPPPPPTTADAGPDPTSVFPDDDDEDDSDLDDDLLDSDGPSSPASATAEDELAAELEKDEMISRNTLALEAQVEERPLAKKQEELQEEEEKQERQETPPADAENGDKPADPEPSQNGSTTPTPEPKKEKPVRKALLKNDDIELARVQRILEFVHDQFYVAFEARKPDESHRSPKKKKRQPDSVDYDVRRIIPAMRMATLEGVHLLFTSVIPLETRPETSEIWKTATAFGAQCYTEISSRLTHVVTNKPSTQKVDAARRYPHIKVVWFQWLNDCISLWRRLDEGPYLLTPPPPRTSNGSGGEGGGGSGALASPPSDPHQISSDPEPDADDWDDVVVDRSRRGALGVEGGSAPPTPSGSGTSFHPDEISWEDINDEVDAAMNESEDDGEDDEDGTPSRKGASVRGGASEDEGSGTDGTRSASPSPQLKRKRVRSLTPSELGQLATAIASTGGEDGLRSPLAKRKKLAADRSGASRLKEGVTAAQLHEDGESASQRSSPANGVGGGEDEEDESSDSSDEDDGSSVNNMVEDDFLARELEAEWG